MPSVLTGANLANRDLIYLGVSGDGDSASIGFGQFAHSIRRGVNMTYIVENNGVYGLTKGQFSATADRGSKSKKGVLNTDNAIDLVAIALQLGASYVARSFSGDKSQLVPLIAGAIQHKGAAFIDVISPCVAFNNHAGSTKSFDYVREHNDAVNRLDVITGREPITVDYAPGTVQVVEQHDGTRLALRKIDADYDAHDRVGAQAFLQKHAAKGQIVTGLLYVDPESEDLHSHLNTVDTPLNELASQGAVPRLRRARQDQRQFALAAHARAGTPAEVAGFPAAAAKNRSIPCRAAPAPREAAAPTGGHRSRREDQGASAAPARRRSRSRPKCRTRAPAIPRRARRAPCAPAARLPSAGRNRPAALPSNPAPPPRR